VRDSAAWLRRFVGFPSPGPCLLHQAIAAIGSGFIDTLESQLKSLVAKTGFSRRSFVMTGLASGFALAVQPVRDTLKAAKKKADTPHGFNADYRPSYRPDAAKHDWNRMLAWFKKYGVA
jgi:dienelactone hydrolase